MATKSALRNKVLKKLRVIAEGETPSSEIITDVEATYDELHADLSTKKAITWDIDEDIPDEAVRSMVSIIAAEIADDFAVDEARYQRLKFESEQALRKLMFLASSTYIANETKSNYF